MITLYTFGPYFGLPDPSPFVMKAEVLLKMADLPFETDTGGFGKAPKGKLPYITDDGEIIANSTFIRLHIEKKYGFDFDAGLSPPNRAIAWAFEKMCENHLYWAGLHARWMVDANFNKGPRRFFDSAPAPLRPLIVTMVRRQVRRNLWGHGWAGTRRPRWISLQPATSAQSLNTWLTSRISWARPRAARMPLFSLSWPTRSARSSKRQSGRAPSSAPNLVAYRDRLMARYFRTLRPKRRLRPDQDGL